MGKNGRGWFEAEDYSDTLSSKEAGPKDPVYIAHRIVNKVQELYVQESRSYMCKIYMHIHGPILTGSWADFDWLMG